MRCLWLGWAGGSVRWSGCIDCGLFDLVAGAGSVWHSGVRVITCPLASTVRCAALQFGVLVGCIQFPPPASAPVPAAAANGAAAAPAVETDLAAALVKAGLGRTAEWGLNMMTTGSFKLREMGALCGSLPHRQATGSWP